MAIASDARERAGPEAMRRQDVMADVKRHAKMRHEPRIRAVLPHVPRINHELVNDCVKTPVLRLSAV